MAGALRGRALPHRYAARQLVFVSALRQQLGGTSPPSKIKSTKLSKPGKSSGLTIFTSSVSLGTGKATQALSWNAPTSNGGMPVTDHLVWACATRFQTPCLNTSPGWVQIADLTGSPPGTTFSNLCEPNGPCAYEIWAKNAIGRSWILGRSSPGTPVNLSATPSLIAPGQVDLHWLDVVDKGAGFGHYVIFECDQNLTCGNGNWTNVTTDAAPWTRVVLNGTATTASYLCNVATSCNFRVGYIDSAGVIGGVTNAVAAAGVSAPVLTARPAPAPARSTSRGFRRRRARTITNYQIDRSTTGPAGTYTHLASGVAAVPTTYTDLTCNPGVSCSYKIRAFYSVGQSPDSNVSTTVSPADTALTITTPAATRASEARPPHSPVARRVRRRLQHRDRAHLRRCHHGRRPAADVAGDAVGSTWHP